MNIVSGAARAVTGAAYLVTSAFGAVGGATVGAVIGLMRGTAQGACSGMGSGTALVQRQLHPQPTTKEAGTESEAKPEEVTAKPQEVEAAPKAESTKDEAAEAASSRRSPGPAHA